jgi:hypothetical protein
MTLCVSRLYGTVVGVLLAATPAFSQAQPLTAAKTGAAVSLRTPWGHPDLQGVWTNTTTTPLERPDPGARRGAVNDEAPPQEAQAAQAPPPARRPARPVNNPGTYNDWWFERGSASRQPSLIVDPPTGRVPALLPAAAVALAEVAEIRLSPPTKPEDLSLFERCITRGMPAAMIPGFYNHNYQIAQNKDYVVILVEMIHDVRVIPLDGRPHLSPAISQWLGDSRGRWEGDTLVVETTNMKAINELRPSKAVFGGSAKTTVVERFRRIDANTMDYQFTVTDAETFTAPWTASTPMTRMDTAIYEYACHEGNYAIVNMLRGARQEEETEARQTEARQTEARKK